MKLFTPLFYITTTIIILSALTGCKNVSYLNAYHQNKDKFSGRAETDAIYLIDLKDDAMLAKDLASLAKDKAYSKAVFNFSDSAVFDYKEFHTSLNLLAIKRQVKMPNSVSEKNHAIYETVFAVKSPNEFDKVYLENMSNTLSKIIKDMETYLTKGEDDSLKDFISKNVVLFKKQRTKIDALIEKVHAVQ